MNSVMPGSVHTDFSTSTTDQCTSSYFLIILLKRLVYFYFLHVWVFYQHGTGVKNLRFSMIMISEVCYSSSQVS